MDPSYREYLRVLQEKNRMIKALRAKEAESNNVQAQRERGFETNFAGANMDRIRLKEERSQGGSSARSRPPRAGEASGGAHAPRERKGWTQGSVHIQTERGSVLRLAPPSRQQTRESMQWLVSTEGRAWLETGEGQDWLEEADEETGGDEEERGDEVADDYEDGNGARAGGAQGEWGQEGGEGRALRIIAATLEFNSLSPEEGFSEFDLDQDGRCAF